jgi:hypothetical protein
MKRRYLAIAWPLLLAHALGCAGLVGDRACERERGAVARGVSESARSVQATCRELRRPDLLLEASDAALLESRDFETAFAWLALLRTLHPDGAESRDVFPTAARVFRKAYLAHRTEAASIWITSERRFMYEWLESFFETCGGFPQRQADALFLGTPWSVFGGFVAFAKERPALADWQLVAEDDNGFVDAVAGEKAITPAS